MTEKERDEFLIKQLANTQISEQSMFATWSMLPAWERFGWLFRHASNKPWFDDLLYNYWSCLKPFRVFPYHYIDPDRFAEALYDFLTGKFPSPYLKNKERGLYEEGHE